MQSSPPRGEGWGGGAYVTSQKTAVKETSLLSKNIRYQNFCNGRGENHRAFFVLSQAIRDIHLLSIVAGLLVVDVVFLSCWIAIDPLQAEILEFKHMVRHCQSPLL